MKTIMAMRGAEISIGIGSSIVRGERPCWNPVAQDNSESDAKSLLLFVAAGWRKEECDCCSLVDFAVD